MGIAERLKGRLTPEATPERGLSTHQATKGLFIVLSWNASFSALYCHLESLVFSRKPKLGVAHTETKGKQMASSADWSPLHPSDGSHLV